MAIYTFLGYDDDQVVFPGGSPSNGETITFTSPSDHTLEFSDGDTTLVDGTDDRDDEDPDQVVTVYDELMNVETSGQVQPRERAVLEDGFGTQYVMHRVYIAASNSYYYIFEDPVPELNVEYTVVSVTTPNSTPYANFAAAGVACFVRGTRIQTPDGPCPIEALGPGDMVSVWTGGTAIVVWTGDRVVTPADLRAQPALQPYLVLPGTLGPRRPSRGLLLSRQHRLMLNGAPVRAHAGRGRVLAAVHTLEALPGVHRICPPLGVHYIHVMTDRHCILSAEGCPAESLLGTEFSRDLVAGFINGPVDGIARATQSSGPACPILEHTAARALAVRLPAREPPRTGQGFAVAGLSHRVQIPPR